MNQISGVTKFLNPVFKFKQYGDAKLYSHTNLPGEFYGFALAYILRKVKYFLLCSNNENFAHTIISFSVSKNKIGFIVECEDVIIDEQVKLMDISCYKGDKNVLKSLALLLKNVGDKF